MNLPTAIVLAVVAGLVFLAVRYHVRSGRKLTDCGCGRGASCKGCHGCDGKPGQARHDV